MMGEHDCFHQANPWPIKDDVLGRFDAGDAEFRDDIVWIRLDWELDCSGRTGFVPVESIEKQLV